MQDAPRMQKPANAEPDATAKTRRVALLVETSTLFGRRLLAGIAQYMRENETWSVFLTERAVNDTTPAWLSRWQGDGIISRVPSPEIRRVIENLHLPTVDLNEQLGSLGVPTISNDHAAVGRLAAQHLLEHGFRQFGFLGHPGHPWSDIRQKAFMETVAEAGYSCTIYPGQSNDVRELCEGTWETEIDTIASWLQGLPQPVGLMASVDYRALQLLSACSLAGISVPQQAAVIGVGGDDVVCDLARPALSSVVLNAWRMGYEAASILDQLMRGETIEQREILIPPLGIQARASTDISAIRDPLVAQAIRYIQKNACTGINVESIVKSLGTSRTSLQDHFRQAIHKSVHDVLLEARLARAKEMLADTAQPIASIALRCGFKHPEYMSSVLKQRTGLTPAAYRQCARSENDSVVRLHATCSKSNPE